MGRQARAVHSSRSVSTFASVALVPARGIQPRHTPQRRLLAEALNRGGNRTINTALHMIAITQIRDAGPGHDYVARLQATGKTRTEAIRLLRRRLSDAVFTALRADERRHHTEPAPATTELALTAAA